MVPKHQLLEVAYQLIFPNECAAGSSEQSHPANFERFQSYTYTYDGS
jgi:hypothetical protein